jgi:hypothetical protein
LDKREDIILCKSCIFWGNNAVIELKGEIRFCNKYKRLTEEFESCYTVERDSEKGATLHA